MNIQKDIDRARLDEKAPAMPWFVQQFIDYKLPDLSPSTLLEYVRDYETFSIGSGRKGCHKPPLTGT